jgi:Ca2+-binding RTX toxin-like protein
MPRPWDLAEYWAGDANVFDAGQFLADLRAALGPDPAAAARRLVSQWDSGGRGDDAPPPPPPQPEPAHLIVGTDGNDRLFGTPEDDVIFGLAGDDAISDGQGPGTGAVNGHNRIFAGPGNDGVNAGYGDDTVDGGPGNDGIDGHGNDGLTPGSTARLWAFDGADLLHGGPGDDTIFGASGADTIDGGPGADVIKGGLGADLLRGGPGADTFQFGFLAADLSLYTPDSGVGEGNRDRIEGFRSGEDHIVLTGPNGYALGIQNLTVTDHGDGLLVAFEALRGGWIWVAQEIEVFGARALAAGDIIL